MKVIRALVRRPGSSLLVVTTLAVAIAASTVTYGVVDLLWHMVPSRPDDRLVFVAQTDPRASESQSGVYNGLAWTGVSIPDLADFAAQTRTIDQFAAYRTSTATLLGLGNPQRISLVRATTNLLSVWRITPTIGHGFTAADGVPGGPGVALISNRFWREQFDASPAAVGRELLLDATPRTVVGILPAALDGSVLLGYDVMVPLELDPARSSRDERRLFTFALLKPQFTIDQASADLEGIARRLTVAYPETNAHTGVVVRPPLEQLGGYLPMLLVLLVAIAIALVLIACANVSNVMLAVAAARQREFSVRAALGASRARQALLALGEGLTLSAVASLGGIVLAWMGIAWLRTLESGPASPFSALALNPRVLGMTVSAGALAPLAFALLPALRVSRAHVTVRESRPGDRVVMNRTRGALVALQVALTVVLLTQIGAFARTAWRLMSAPTGFDRSNLLTFRLELPPARYADVEARGRFVSALLSQLSQSPTVVAAAAINRLPIADREESGRLAIAGTDRLPKDEPPVTIARITDTYPRTMRIPVMRGRGFQSDDVERQRRVALVSEAAARRYWPGADPIGQRIALTRASGTPNWLEVVGIIGDVRNSDVDQGPPPQVYVPLSMTTEGQIAFVVRTEADPVSVSATIHGDVARIDRTLPVFGMQTMDAVIFSDTAGAFMILSILTAIAFVSACVAAAGIYGLTSFSVTQRTPEIGVRMALGARSTTVLRMVIGQTARPVLVGAVVGAIAMVALASFASRAISGVDFRDPFDYVTVLVALMTLALAATYLPARRATRIDPAVALRGE